MIKFFKLLLARTLIVEVTQKDIDEGVAFHADRCPLALALNRTLGGKWVVGPRTIFSGGLTDRKFKLPEEASQFREDFDRGREVQPFNFILGE